MLTKKFFNDKITLHLNKLKLYIHKIMRNIPEVKSELSVLQNLKKIFLQELVMK